MSDRGEERPISGEVFAVTIRLSLAAGRFVQSEAKRIGSVNDYIRSIVNDARTFYGLPEAQVARLDAQAKKLGKSRRELISMVLSSLADDLLREEVRAELTKGSKK